jgi:hypothetical protein
VRPLQRGGGVQHCHGRGRPGQVHPGRPVHVQPVPRTVFVGTVRRSSSGRSKPSAGAIARPTFFEHLNGGRTCESAMPAFRGQAESGAAPLAAAASTWPLVLSNSTNAPSLARLANAARIAVSTVGPYCQHGLALVEACAIRARPPITASARVVLERVALSFSPGSRGALRDRRQACDRSIRSGSWERGLLGGVPTAALELLVELLDQTD